MAATTTEMDPVLLYKDRFMALGGPSINSSIGYASTNAAASHLPGAVNLTTANDVIRFPFNRPDGKMALVAQFNIGGSTVAWYPALALRYPPSTDKVAWRTLHGIGTSTAETGWKMHYSTVATDGSSGRYTYVIGPFESALWGHVFSASSNGIDAGQPFLECSLLLSSVAAGTYVKATTNECSTASVQKSILAIELP
ncbi:MAG: hypothetical protein WC406_05895 [Methanoregula sp.]